MLARAYSDSRRSLCAARGSTLFQLWCILLIPYSIGLALTDTLDDLISDERISPQVAMKILGNFDQAMTDALQKNVKARMSFKVLYNC